MIPFLDLQAQYHSIKDDLQGAINTVLASGRFVLGEEVAAFEQEFAEYCQAQYAVGVNSGTSALHLALLAAGVGPGDEVITVAFTFVATLAAILFTGAQPVLVDIDPVSYCMDASQLEASINPNTKAIVPVHLYGQPADMEPILQIARQYGLVVIEDAAQAHGAVYQGCRVGGIGDLACFSFYPAKNLGAFGEAGIVVTSDPNYAQKVRMLRDWGQAQKHHHRLRGFNYRMDAIQGAVLRVKLRHLDRWNAARSSVASRYDSLLADADLHLPSSLPDRQHVYHIYAVRSPERDRLIAALHARGIHVSIHYPYAIHQLPAYAGFGYAVGDFPVAEKMAREVLSLPIYPEMPAENVELVVAAIKAHLS